MNEIDYKVIYIPTTNNLTSVHAYVKTGNVCETSKNSGIAHLLEHVIADSWDKCAGNCKTFWSKRGIFSNAQTTTLYTRYFITGLTKEIENIIDYMASIMTNPRFDAKTINSAKLAVMDELLIRTNNPGWRLYDNFFKSFNDNLTNGFGRSYDYPLKIKNLETITPKDLSDYYHKWYRPNNTFFIVVSNEPLSKINLLFSNYLFRRPIMTFLPTSYSLNCNRHVSVVYRKDAEKSTFIIGFINNKQHPKDFMYYEIIKDMLTGDMSSLLYRILRDDLNLIYGIKLDYDMNSSFIVSMFEVNCQIKNSQKLITALVSSLKKFVSGRFDGKLLSRSKERLTILDMTRSKENTEMISDFYANQFIMSGKYDVTQDAYMKFVSGISKDKLLGVAKRLFQFNKMVISCETKGVPI